VQGRLVVEGEQRTLSPNAEACLYQVAKESVSNIVKHAGATSFEVVLTYAEEGVSLRVSDDGNGFEHSEAQRRARDGVSYGLRSIGERVKREEGRLDVVSAPGQGTTIYVRLPV